MKEVLKATEASLFSSSSLTLYSYVKPRRDEREK